MARRSGLGKGLGALIPGEHAEANGAAPSGGQHAARPAASRSVAYPSAPGAGASELSLPAQRAAPRRGI